jgi:hypothetical protein
MLQTAGTAILVSIFFTVSQKTLHSKGFPFVLRSPNDLATFTSSKVPDAVGTTFAPYAASRPESLMPNYTKCSGKETATFMQDLPFLLPTIDVFPSSYLQVWTTERRYLSSKYVLTLAVCTWSRANFISRRTC